jgi:dTDP-4-amino-4,6-dideoxygalactose transaminase
MHGNPHQVTRDFEKAIAAYTGAPYAVAVNSCTMALFLACKYVGVGEVILPKRTYVGVPAHVIHAGGTVRFEDRTWRGAYRLWPHRIYDAARRFTSGMFDATGGTSTYATEEGPALEPKYICVSFHSSKILGIEQGGAILHDNEEADSWFRRARFDGRSEGIEPKDDTFPVLGYHCYINPSTAAQGILKLHSLPKRNEDLHNSPYPDLSTLEIFK